MATHSDRIKENERHIIEIDREVASIFRKREEDLIRTTEFRQEQKDNWKSLDKELSRIWKFIWTILGTVLATAIGLIIKIVLESGG